MRSDEALDPIRSLRVALTLLNTAGMALWGRAALLFVGEVGGAWALTLAILAWPPNSRCGNAWHLREIRIAGVVGLTLFVASCVAWRNFARAVERSVPDFAAPPRSKPRVLAILSARFVSESLLLMAVLPSALKTLLSIQWPGNAARLAALILWLCGFAYVALGLSFVPQVAAFEGLGVLACLKRSWSLARGRRLRLVVYRATLFVIVALGACSCIGIFIAMPLVNIARVESYAALTQAHDRAAPPA